MWWNQETFLEERADLRIKEEQDKSRGWTVGTITKDLNDIR